MIRQVRCLTRTVPAPAGFTGGDYFDVRQGIDVGLIKQAFVLLKF